MKIFLTLFLCLFFGCNVFGQTENIENKEELKVEEISLARDDGNGNAGQLADNFMATDFPIHCFVQLNSAAAVTIKMNFVAVRALNLKPEAKVVVVSFKTNENQDSVNFTASPEKVWAAGDYRVDIFSTASSPQQIVNDSKISGWYFKRKPEPAEKQRTSESRAQVKEKLKEIIHKIER